MSWTEIFLAALLFGCALICGILSGMQLTEHGEPLNNLYDPQSDGGKKPYFRQAGVVLAMAALIFVLCGIGVLLHFRRILWAVLAVIAVIVIYVAVSSARMRK